MGAQPAVQKVRTALRMRGNEQQFHVRYMYAQSYGGGKPPVHFSDQATSASWKDSGKSAVSNDSSKSMETLLVAAVTHREARWSAC